jgi:hypothetical protein
VPGVDPARGARRGQALRGERDPPRGAGGQALGGRGQALGGLGGALGRLGGALGGGRDIPC